MAICLLLGLTTASAQALTSQRVGSFQQPIYVTSAPDNPDRLFVVERAGTVVVLENGEVKPFADIRQAVSCCTVERGLQSIALSPDFAQSGRFFLFYTGEEEPGELHIAEMVAGSAGAPADTLRDVIAPIPHGANANHNGGQLQFGPDGALYASTGDGGGGDDELHNAQDPTSFLGKLLRIVPSQIGTVAPTVWSLGLRNPFRFSFDRQTNDLWIGDVGQGKWEEVDFAAAPTMGQNANFGWNCFEGDEPGPATDPECASPPPGGYAKPVFEYENPPDNGAALIGGYVARDPGLGDTFGRYLYGDYFVGDVRSFSLAAPSATDRYEGVHVDKLTSFGEDSCKRLYAVSGEGPVYRLLGSGPVSCGSSPTPTLTPSLLRVRAASRKVKRNRRGFISAWASPCNGRRGGQVTLWRGRRNLGTRRLDRVCSARFRPRIKRRSSFRVTLKADQSFAAAISRRLTIRPLRRHRR
ncbi:MAG TPA: PQQ-dependent sugar dehydrogenase [Solirubrobacterales bacterium]|nr:PQQ-dependent sugar dehydrogenase [Solirubrobacterales bacterium]